LTVKNHSLTDRLQASASPPPPRLGSGGLSRLLLAFLLTVVQVVKELVFRPVGRALPGS
jgi:hypothetical protein